MPQVDCAEVIRVICSDQYQYQGRARVAFVSMERSDESRNSLRPTLEKGKDGFCNGWKSKRIGIMCAE